MSLHNWVHGIQFERKVEAHNILSLSYVHLSVLKSQVNSLLFSFPQLGTDLCHAGLQPN